MSVIDKKLGREVLRELVTRRSGLDISGANISVTRAVAYIGGVIKPQLGYYITNHKEEMAAIADLVKKIPGIRDVVIDAQFVTTKKNL